MKRKSILARCLIFTVLTSSCGAAGDSLSASDTVTEDSPDFVYDYPELGEGEFNILSSESVWDIYMDLGKR